MLAAWPLPDGDNPFGNRQAAEGRGSRLAVIALSGLGVALVASTPIMVAAYLGRDAWWAWLVPVFGLAWALMIGGAVVAWVGRTLRGSEAELCERLSPIALN